MQAFRVLLLSTLATSLLLAGCSPGSISPSQWIAPADPTADYPGTHERGQAAVYRVVQGVDESGAQGLDIGPIDEQSPLRNATPVAGAIVRYPDGSTQTTLSDGTFDSSTSAYAAISPEALGAADVNVTVEPPAGLNLEPIGMTIFVPSPLTEGRSESGSIPPDTAPPAQPGAKQKQELTYIWSCNGRDYEQGISHVVFGWQQYAQTPTKIGWREERGYGITFVTASMHTWFYGRIFVCGTDMPDWQRAEVVENRWASADGYSVTWTIIIRARQTKMPPAVPHDAVWAQPNNYFFSMNRHLQLICPYYFDRERTQVEGCSS